jgi:threonine/homoserine/homoserine lactone efflux protein
MVNKKAHILIKGFRLGILLQIAVGPVCFFIFQTAAVSGFLAAESGVLGVVLVDSLFILAALMGLGALIEKKPALRRALKYVGAAVLVLFGLNLIAGAFNDGFIPGLDLSDTGAGSAFLRAALITLSSPLTIIFWAGVFSQRLAEENLHRRDMTAYGLGAVLSTLIFLSATAALGTLTNAFLSDDAIRILNAVVGLLLIVFGIRTAVKKSNCEKALPY